MTRGAKEPTPLRASIVAQWIRGRLASASVARSGLGGSREGWRWVALALALAVAVAVESGSEKIAVAGTRTYLQHTRSVSLCPSPPPLERQ